MLETTDGAGGGIASTSRWGAFQQTLAGFTHRPTSHATWYDFSVTAIDPSGALVDTDAGGVGPLATLRAALDHLGSWNDGDVRIALVADVEEDLEIEGLAGGGRVIVDGGLVATLYGRIRFYGVHQFVEVRDLTLQHVAETSLSGVEMRTARHIELNNLDAGERRLVQRRPRDGGVGGPGRQLPMNGYTTNAVQCIEGSTLFCSTSAPEARRRATARPSPSSLSTGPSRPSRR